MAMPQTLSIYVAGRWRPGAGAEYTTEYPADGSVAFHAIARRKCSLTASMRSDTEGGAKISPVAK